MDMKSSLYSPDEAYLYASEDCTGKIGYVINDPKPDCPLMKVHKEQLGDFEDKLASFRVPAGFLMQLWEKPFYGKSLIVRGDGTCMKLEGLIFDVDTNVIDDVTSLEYWRDAGS